MAIPAELRRKVRVRADDRCEYCRLRQEHYDLNFHVEHIVARQHQEDDSFENLALSCDLCNLLKGTNLSSIDPQTGEVVRLYNPRNQEWDGQFHLIGAEFFGITPTGRATVNLLQFNSERRIFLRRQIQEEQDFRSG